MKRPTILRKACGIGLIVAGLVAIPLPILPGLPLVLAGAAMLGIEHPAIRWCRQWLRNKGIKVLERKQDELAGM